MKLQDMCLDSALDLILTLFIYFENNLVAWPTLLDVPEHWFTNKHASFVMHKVTTLGKNSNLSITTYAPSKSPWGGIEGEKTLLLLRWERSKTAIAM